MVSPRRDELATEKEAECSLSNPTIQSGTGKSALEELQAKVGQFLKRERPFIEGKVAIPTSDDEDSEDGGVSDSSSHKGEKLKIRSIMRGFREDSAFYQSAKHQCEWIGCQFQSGKQRKFIMHVERHASNVDSDDDGYACKWQLCDFSTKSRDDFVGHVHYHAYHTKLKVFGARLIATMNIPVCSFRSNHRNKIPNGTNYKCAWSDCRMRFIKIMDFALHVDSHYSDLYANRAKGEKKAPKCQWSGCKSINASLYMAKMHGQKHTGPRFIACANCGHIFVRRDLLVKHCLPEPKPKTPNFKCNEIGCGKEFYKISAYERHIRTHYNRPLSNYDCAICNKGFFSKIWLSKHLMRKHKVSANNAETGKITLARRVQRRRSTSEEDTSDEYSCHEDSSEEGSIEAGLAGGTPKKTVTRVKPQEPRYPSRGSRSVKSSVSHGTPERRQILARGVKRRRSTSEEDTSEESSSEEGSIVQEPVSVTRVKAEPEEPSTPRGRTYKTLLNYFSPLTSVNNETPEHVSDIVTRGVKRRSSEKKISND
uniref:C2H2-type domain-containing protein n=1 Tax=Anopheles albimanus TaxID=7167 RepID=A0A2C9GGU8_ANOAL